MKKILIALSLTALTLSGCSYIWGEEEESPREEQREEKMLEGIIQKKDLAVGDSGTHTIIQANGATTNIQSSKFDLNQYLDKQVKIRGYIERLNAGTRPVFEVSSVQVLKNKSEDSSETTTYNSNTLDISFKYPPEIKVRPRDTQLIFTDEAEKRIFTAEKTPTVEDGKRQVEINGQLGYRVDKEDGSVVIYLPTPGSGDYLRFAFVGESEEMRTRFYDLIETIEFASADSDGPAEPCGGEENKTCAEGFACELESTEENAEGKCVSIAKIEAEKEAREKEEEERKKNEEESKEEEKKVEEDERETEEANKEKEDEDWRESENSGNDDDDDSDDSDEVTVKPEYKTVQNEIRSDFDELLDTGNSGSISSFEFIDPDIVAVIYSSDGKPGKIVFSYEMNGSNVHLTEEARYEEGDTTTWKRVSGENVLGSKEKTVIKGDKAVSVPEGYSLFESSANAFQTYYPKKWYYSVINTDDAITRFGFANEPVGDGNEIASIDIVEGSLESLGKSHLAEETTSDKIRIFVKRNDGTSFVVHGNADQAEALRTIAGSLEVVE